jgi:hypothetical protein
MRQPEPVENPQRRRTVAAVARFVALMHARERNEPAKAAVALAELARLGVVIRFHRKAVRHAR